MQAALEEGEVLPSGPSMLPDDIIDISSEQADDAASTEGSAGRANRVRLCFTT